MSRRVGRARQRDQVAAGHDVNLGGEALPGHPPLEVQREEPVVTAGQHPGRHVRPAVDGARLAERDAGPSG